MSEVLRDRIIVRMYRGILGDCFLLTHHQAQRTTRILIDCGVLQNVDGGPAQIRRIAENIRQTLATERGGTPEIDLLVVTHEHADHVSGFAAARELFLDGGLKFKQLWMAWTEDPQDEQAQALGKKFKQARVALALAAQAGAVAGGTDPALRTVADLQNFLGPVETPALAATGSLTTGQILKGLKLAAGPERTCYLRPGEARSIAPGLRAYVLGPPKNEDRLAKDAPSRGANREVYLTQSDEGYAVESAARAALDRLPAVDPNQIPTAASPAQLPFAKKYSQLSIADAEERAKGDPKAATDPYVLYFRDPQRQIDEEWTAAAETLALKMDSDTNNTSLVLAFELMDKQVLLFAADAQVGNWLSWGDQTYPSSDDPTAPALSIEVILRRVTFYKVGHHASHNATLKAQGLEKMTDPRLCAAIPVVEKVARRQGASGWDMPDTDLYPNLCNATFNRVVRGDGDPEDELAAFAAKPTDPERPVTLAYGPKGESDGDGAPLWVEVVIPIS